MENSNSNTDKNSFALSRVDTSVMKGIAILAMLFHHLYGCPMDGLEPYSGVSAWVGTLGKFCVALFLFCSGYGLSANYKPQSIIDDVKFVVKRMAKFYANYWVIFFIFVPISIFVFHRSLTDVYGNDANILKCFCFDLLGIQGCNSYNITWWFNKLIIWLYILFPLLYRIIRIQPLIVLILSMVIMGKSEYIPINSADIWLWQFPFVLGVGWKLLEDKYPKVQEWLTTHSVVFGMISVFLLCIAITLRMWPIIPGWDGVYMDGFIATAIALCTISLLRRTKHTTNTLSFLGKHSMNIYMMHTFFNAYWFSGWLHTATWMRDGVNFFVLLAICLIISIGIEYLKEKIRLNEFVNNIIQRI